MSYAQKNKTINQVDTLVVLTSVIILKNEKNEKSFHCLSFFFSENVCLDNKFIEKNFKF